MIKYFPVARPANLIELAGDRDILIARARVAARMIVDENDRSGIEFERAPEDCPGIDRKLRKGSVLELLVSEVPPCPVEEQYAQPLDRQRTHRRDHLLAQDRKSDGKGQGVSYR